VSLLRHIGIALGLEDLLGKKVDLITEGTLLPFAKETADKDKVLIYERAS
jgi:predicted nucleotidyltransferase